MLKNKVNIGSPRETLHRTIKLIYSKLRCLTIIKRLKRKNRTRK